jgi:toxin-antitoxin system PIN domain toxin
LDTNVLLALAWPNHVHHEHAREWFRRKAAASFRTCPITQTGFVRISSNPSFTPHAVTPGEAVLLLSQIIRLPGHDFWPDDLSIEAALHPPPEIVGHRQVTDAYLLALAAKNRGVLATLDRAAAALAVGHREWLELLFDN